MVNVNIHFNQQQLEVLEEKKKKFGYKTIYECVKREACRDLNPKLESFEDEVKNLPTTELDKLFNKLADSDKFSLKTKKNASWFFERFFNDIYDLYKHKAPVVEFIDTCLRYNYISIVVQELMKRRGEKLQSWDDIHRLASKIKPFDYKYEQTVRQYR